MADSKNYNQNISTEYEKWKNDDEEIGFFDSIYWLINTSLKITRNEFLGRDKDPQLKEDLEKNAQVFVDDFWNAVYDWTEWLWNQMEWDKKWKIEKAQQIQNQIDQLTERYYNWTWYAAEERSKMYEEIKNLTQDRDKMLTPQHRYSATITPYDIWYRTAKKDRKDTAPDEIRKSQYEKKSADELATQMKGYMEEKNNQSMITFWNQVNEDIKAWKTTQQEVQSWEYFLKMANDRSWQWLYWYLNEFINDADAMANHKTFTLTDWQWRVRTYFDEDARQVITTLVTSDDIQKAIQNNYEVVKTVEEWLDSDLPQEKAYAQTDYVQSIYNTAIKNLNNLKQETAYLYDNFWKYNWDVFAIEDAFQKETWRKMFSTAEDSTAMAMSRWKDYTSEDRATAAMHTLNVAWDINIDYPATSKYVMKHNWVTDTFSVLWLVWNTLRDAIAAGTDKAAIYTNSAYYATFRNEYTWGDIQELIDMNSNVQMWMWSMRSLKNELTNWESRWSRTYDTILAVWDASPTISKEALTFAASEYLMDAMWVQSTAEMAAEIQKWRQYVKIVGWNNWLLEFDETWIIWAKLMEFYWRWMIQNYLLSASAAGNFAEPYSDLDLWLDIAFWFIDVMTLSKWLTLWRWKLVLETKNQIMRQALKDTLNITDAQWEKLMATSQGRSLVDKTATELWEQWTKAIDELWRQAWSTREEILAEINKAIKDANSQWKQSWKIYTNAKNRIWKTLNELEQWALAQAVAKGWWDIANMSSKSAEEILKDTKNTLERKWFSKSIIDNLELTTTKLMNWQEYRQWWWKKALTTEEFKEIIEKTQIPVFTRIWYRMQNLLKSWNWEFKSNIQNYKDKVSKLKKIDRTTEEWKIEYDKLTREINKDYNRHLRDTMVTWTKDNLYATPVSFRRWEYEKYWRPHWYKYWDVEYTYLWQWNTKEEVQAALDERLKEYSKEIEDARKWFWFYYQYSNWLTTSAIKFSNEITWKVNLVWMKFEKACEYNPNLKLTWEWFFIAVSNADWLEVYQKNMILWSVTKKWKVTWDRWTLFHITWTKVRKWEVPHQRITTFGSSFEQEFFLWKNGTFWKVEILKKWWIIEWEYNVLSHHNWTFLRIKDETWRKFTIQIKEWKFLMDDHTARITWWVLDIRFSKYWGNKYSWIVDLYWEAWEFFEKRVNKLRLEQPKLYWYISTMQKLELALTKNNDKLTFKSKKQKVRNRYQSSFAQDSFKEPKILSSIEMKSWYLDIVNDFEVPFSYFMEVKKMIKEWLITEKEWAAMILSASWSRILENSDYFIVNEWAKIKWTLQTHVFHQCWVVMLPSTDQFWFKPYFYERVSWSEWLYNLYAPDSSEFAIWQLWINPETWNIYLRMWDEQPKPIYSLRIDKHIAADYDSKRYTKYSSEKFQEKRKIAFSEFVNKSNETVFNFDLIQDLEKDAKELAKDKFQVITKWDTRWLRNSYNPDIKVAKENQKEINDIFHFKQLTTQTPWAQWAMFYSLIKYSILPRFYELNTWVRDIHEWAEILKASKNSWLDHNLKFVDISWDDTRIFVDTHNMWFDVNYIYNQDLKKWTIIMKVQDWTPEWRIVSIDYIWKFNLEDVNWQKYMRIWLAWQDWYDYYIKLTPSLERLDAFEVNTLLLSKSDYDQFILNQSRMRKAIWTRSWFIYNNMNDFPEPVRKLIFQWADETEIYTAMKTMIVSNEMMKEIAEVKWIKLETATMENMLNITKEYEEVVRAMKDVRKLWYSVPEEKMLQYYKYLYWKNTFWKSSIVDIIDWKLWLSLFRERTVSSWIREWLTNLVLIDRWWQKLSDGFYNYAQRRIMELRLAKFEEDFNAWVFSQWLDLSKAVDYQKYQDNVRAAYQYATQIINVTDIRKEWYSLRRRWVIKKYAWQWQHLQLLYINASNVNDLSKILIKTKSVLWDISWIRWTWHKAQKKIDKKLKLARNIEPWINRYDKIFYDKNGNKKTIEEIADTVNELIEMWFTEDEVAVKLAEWLIESWWARYWLDRIIELEKDFIKSADQYKSLFEGSRLSLWDIENLNSKERWNVLQVNFDKDIKMLENHLLVPKDIKNSKRLRQQLMSWIRQLRKDANLILEFNKMWEDVSSLVEDYLKTRQEIINAYESVVWKINYDINQYITEEKKSLNVSYNETKKTKPLDDIVDDVEGIFDPEEVKEWKNSHNFEDEHFREWLKDDPDLNNAWKIKEVYWIDTFNKLDFLKYKKQKLRSELIEERNMKQTKLKKDWNNLSQDNQYALEIRIRTLNAEITKINSDLRTIEEKIQQWKDWPFRRFMFDVTDETTIRITKKINELIEEYDNLMDKRTKWEISEAEWNKQSDIITDHRIDYIEELEDYKSSLDWLEWTQEDLNSLKASIETETEKPLLWGSTWEPIEVGSDVKAKEKIENEWIDVDAIKTEEEQEIAFMWAEDIQETTEAVEEVKEITEDLEPEKTPKKWWRPKKEKKEVVIEKKDTTTAWNPTRWKEKWVWATFDKWEWWYTTQEMKPFLSPKIVTDADNINNTFRWRDPTWQQFINWTYEWWSSYFDMLDNIIYSNVEAKEYWKISNHFLLENLINDWFREWYSRMFQSSDTLKMFLNSEEWITMVLNTMYYRIPMPEKLIKAIEDVYWLKLQRWISYDEAFNMTKRQIERKYKLKVAKANPGGLNYWFWKINDDWKSYSFFKYLDTIPNEKVVVTDETFKKTWKNTWYFWRWTVSNKSDFTKQKDYTTLWLYNKYAEVGWWEFVEKNIDNINKIKELYKKWRLSTEEKEILENLLKDERLANIALYKLYLDNVYDRWIWLFTRLESWPMSIFEFFTLRRLSKESKMAAEYLDSILKPKNFWDYYKQIPFWAQDWNWRKDFYQLLSDEDNRELFVSTLKYRPWNEWYLSKYYQRNYNDTAYRTQHWLNNESKINTKWLTKKQIEKIQAIKDDAMWNFWRYVADTNDYKDVMNMFTEWDYAVYYRTYYKDIVIQTPYAKDMDEIEKIADTKPDVFNKPEINQLNEVTVPINRSSVADSEGVKWIEKRWKQLSDTTTLESKKITCKK